MLTRALDAGVPAAWVTGDEAYGQVGRLRAMLEDRGMSYVLAVPSNQYVMPAGAGAGRIDAAVAALAPQAWTTISVGAGAKARGSISGPARRSGRWPGPATGCSPGAASPTPPTSPTTWPPARRGPRCVSSPGSPGSAGRSRKPSRPPRARSDSTTTRSDAIQAGTATSPWPCSPTPSSPSPEPPPRPGKKGALARPAPVGELIPLTLPEVRRLLAGLIWTPDPKPNRVLSWSRWRRRHQARARHCHYETRTRPTQFRL